MNMVGDMATHVKPCVGDIVCDEICGDDDIIDGMY